MHECEFPARQGFFGTCSVLAAMWPAGENGHKGRLNFLYAHFYGYRPYTFISGQKKNQDYSIILKPSFQPNFFHETEFRIKRKQLIDIKRKGKFKMTKSGM